MGQGKAEAPAADDLLSQMAGDEIDRLLAEAENEPPLPPAAPTAPAASTVAPASAVSGETVAAPSAVGQTPPASTEMKSPPTGQAAPAPAETKTAHADHVAPAPVIAASPAPTAPAVQPIPHPIMATPEVDDPAPATRLALGSVFIRVLELLNSPLDDLDDSLRQTIGWIAIVTLFNAVVVLGYVRFFRHK
ncbi:MAG TPA: hypothetical protein VG326_15530 [Tepidisphaeraceae bacterium]|nr:hypothetical protein [Tepidisphaeraceae bacterium]